MMRNTMPTRQRNRPRIESQSNCRGYTRFIPLLLLLGLTAWAEENPLPGASGDPDDPVRPNFSGVWLLNRAESDDVQSMLAEAAADIRAARPRQPGSGGGGRGGRSGYGRGSGRGGGSAGGGRGRSGEQGPSRQEGGGESSGSPLLAALAQGLERLLISHTGDVFEIEDGTQRIRSLTTDGEARQPEAEAGKITERALWNQDNLVTEREFADRAKVSTIYRLVPADNRLLVTIQIELRSLGKEYEVHLTYDSA